MSIKCFELGLTQALLMQKIEKLSLYTLNMNMQLGLLKKTK